MLIHVRHSEYKAVELKGGSLFIQTAQNGRRLLLENVAYAAVAVWESYLHVVAFGENQDYAWHFHGERGLNRDRLELGQVYGGGARLVFDSEGNGHLLYLVRQTLGSCAQLKHHIFTGAWGAPLAVSSDVLPHRSAFSTAWHRDGFLHIVYCDYRKQRLYYRVFDTKANVWSGAIPFSQHRGGDPYLVSADRLYLFWREENGETAFYVREKEEVWSDPVRLSGAGLYTGGTGFAVENGEWVVFWQEEGGVFRTSFGNWPGRREVASNEYEYIWVVERGIVLPTYKRGRQAMIVQTKPEKKAQWAVNGGEAGEKSDENEPGGQSRFLSLAESLLLDWEILRGEINRWRRDMSKPESVDLRPVLDRCEHLERRFVSLGRTQKLFAEQLGAEQEIIRQAVAKLERRLLSLEQAERERRARFWHRLWKKD